MTHVIEIPALCPSLSFKLSISELFSAPVAVHVDADNADTDDDDDANDDDDEEDDDDVDVNSSNLWEGACGYLRLIDCSAAMLLNV